MSTLYDASPRRTPFQRFTPIIMVVLGALMIAWAAMQVGKVWWETDGSRASSDKAAAQMVSNLHNSWKGVSTSDGSVAVNPGVDGTPFATITVPKFGSDWIEPVIQGTTLAELGTGVGHVPGSAMPGQIGNVGLAGHRTTHSRPFNRIAELTKGDKVVITTAEATYTYSVVSHEIVTPDKVHVFDPVPNKPGAKAHEQWLTLSSCHPFYSASHRYVVFAKLTSTHRN